jgi:hypothetical protein
MIKAPRVKESPVQFECKVKEIITLGENGGAGHLVICEVLKLHIRESVIDEKNRIDPNKLDLVGRLGRAYYVRASGDALFTLFQEPEQMALGFDKLPDSVRKSPYLSGNELACIASLTEFPTAEDVQKVLEEDDELKEILEKDKGHDDMLYRDLHRYAERAIKQEANRLAFCVLMIADTYHKPKK